MTHTRATLPRNVKQGPTALWGDGYSQYCPIKIGLPKSTFHTDTSYYYGTAGLPLFYGVQYGEAWTLGNPMRYLENAPQVDNPILIPLPSIERYYEIIFGLRTITVDYNVTVNFESTRLSRTNPDRSRSYNGSGTQRFHRSSGVRKKLISQNNNAYYSSEKTEPREDGNEFANYSYGRESYMYAINESTPYLMPDGSVMPLDYFRNDPYEYDIPEERSCSYYRWIATDTGENDRIYHTRNKFGADSWYVNSPLAGTGKYLNFELYAVYNDPQLTSFQRYFLGLSYVTELANDDQKDPMFSFYWKLSAGLAIKADTGERLPTPFMQTEWQASRPYFDINITLDGVTYSGIGQCTGLGVSRQQSATGSVNIRLDDFF